jgi:hypothetical protein
VDVFAWPLLCNKLTHLPGQMTLSACAARRGAVTRMKSMGWTSSGSGCVFTMPVSAACSMAW